MYMAGSRGNVDAGEQSLSSVLVTWSPAIGNPYRSTVTEEAQRRRASAPN